MTSQTLDYSEYCAKDPRATEHISSARDIGRAVRTFMCDSLLLPYGLMRHRQLLDSGIRVDNHTYTCFLRAPTQLRLLCGPILSHLGRPGKLDITLLACSNGAEPYTIASWLLQNVPSLDFHIHASDLHPAMIERARNATYTRDEVLHSDYITRSFLDATFLDHGAGYIVRPEIRDRVSFSTASLLDGASLREQFGTSSLVVAQNVLFHLDPINCVYAFENLVNLTAPGGVLMVEGMDLDLREKLAKFHGLEPFTEDQEKIHEETRIHTPARWWRFYWGTEPYIARRKNSRVRYATAFRRPVDCG